MYLTFNHAEYLWYLLSIPLLIVSHFTFLKYTKRKAMRFANFQALKKVSGEKILTKNHILLILRVCVIISLVFAIAGTVFWYKGMTNHNDFILAIDTSSSMSAKDIEPTRIEAAKIYSQDFANNMPADSSIGVVSFSGASFIEQLPVKDKSEVKQSIQDIELAHVGGTDIPGAIVTSTNLLLSSKQGRSIILLTDGSNTASYFTRDPIDEGIKYAKENNVIVYTIGVGTNTGPIGYLPEYYNISSVYDEQVLIKIANETGGKYFAASNSQGLESAYKDILADSKQAYIGVDLSIGLTILTLALILLEWGLISTRFRAVP